MHEQISQAAAQLALVSVPLHWQTAAKITARPATVLHCLAQNRLPTYCPEA